MKRLYVSGKIAGIPEPEAIENFLKACNDLLDAGYETLNPFEIGNCSDREPFPCRGDDHYTMGTHTWECYLRYDIMWMLPCDGVALLDNWTTSKGAVLELFVARQCGLPVKTVSDWINL